MLRFEKTATPFTGATGPPPDSVPGKSKPPLCPIATTTEPTRLVAWLPTASYAVTRTGGWMVAPARVLLGGTVNTSCVAAPGTIVNAVLETFGRPFAAATRV